MSTTPRISKRIPLVAILVVTSALLLALKPVFKNATSQSSATLACSDYLTEAVADSIFDDGDWFSSFVVNQGSPPWTIDFGVQTNDSEDVDPVTGHYEDPADPPVRYVRFSRNGTPDPDAYAMVGTLYNRTVVPLPSGSVSFIRFDYDQFGSWQRVAPLIYQNDRYYRGPERVARRDSGWHTVSTGCLRASDFEDLTGPFDPNVNLSLGRPMMVGYSLAWETAQGFGLRDHLIDNFRVMLDANSTVVDTSSTNRPPFAINDWIVTLVENGHTTKAFKVRHNDNDPDGDPISITSYSSPNLGTLTPGSIDPITDPSSPDFTYGAIDLPLIDGPLYDYFTYEISDGEFVASAQSTIIFDYACWLLEIGFSVAKGLQSDFDLDLARRFRDEAMRTTEAGSLWVDYYYNTAPEIMKILVFDRTDLAVSAVHMVESLQPAMMNFLDGDGSVPIEQAQVDSVSAFFASLREAGSGNLKLLIDTEMDKLGSLDEYVGMPVGEVLNTVLGPEIATANESEVPPGESSLGLRAFPNPFAYTIRIGYELADPTHVNVAVYDVAGRRVRILREGAERPGLRNEDWDGRDEAGHDLPAGVYFVRVSTEQVSASKALILVR